MSRLLGFLGERQAERYLKRLGYKIITRNYFSHFGEIDLIVSDKDCIVFVEVKKRKADSLASGAEFVDTFKQKKIIKTAMLYIQQYNLTCDMRFDVVEINGRCINHIKNAFFC